MLGLVSSSILSGEPWHLWKDFGSYGLQDEAMHI